MEIKMDDFKDLNLISGQYYFIILLLFFYEKYDIKFISKTGKEIFVEVKSTTGYKEFQENMPISYRELTMIEECNTDAEKEYFIVRVFGIDRPTQDIYVFKGYLSTENNILGIEQ